MDDRIYSIENDKNAFMQMLKVKAGYNEKKKELSNAIYNAEQEIERADGLISQTVDELTTAFLMRRSKKEEKCAYIERLKSEKDAGYDKIAEYKDSIRELKIETFGCERLPKLCFGKYPRQPQGEAEPMEWDVMRLHDDRALLLNAYIIEQMQYADELIDTPWSDSKIRAWLNGEFYETAFSDDEKAMISKTEIANPGNDVYKTAESKNTRDLIFIPSMNDVRRFYGYDKARICEATPLAVQNGVYVDEKTGASYWWLRSNGGNLYNASVVNFKGYVFEYGFYVNSTEYGVRPLMWIDLK